NEIEIINSTFENIEQSSSGNGAVINAELRSGSLLSINESSSFINCISGTNGGGIYSTISGGSIELNEITINECSAPNGGAIYVNIDFTTQFTFVVIDSLFFNCKAKVNSSLQYFESGFGAGIFVAGRGNYDILSNALDLRGMKFYNNSADKSGQTLFVVMSSLQDLCKKDEGKYVKGNYSDTQSIVGELEGISIDYTIFISQTQDQIEQQQHHLQYYWSNIVTLTKVNATLNTSNTEPLRFVLEGQNMISGQLSVKIVELRLKTQDELNDSTDPIEITGDPIIEQTATFSMSNYSWLEYKKKWYGLLASNDKRIYVGIEQKERETLGLKVEIEEDVNDIEEIQEGIIDTTQTEPKGSNVPWWIIKEETITYSSR
ncbi:MAG: hypothetical protein EZS28_030010, partial [Streblomastix strix]